MNLNKLVPLPFHSHFHLFPKGKYLCFNDIKILWSKTIEFLERLKVPEECPVFQFLFIGHYEHSFLEWREKLRLKPSMTERTTIPVQEIMNK